MTQQDQPNLWEENLSLSLDALRTFLTTEDITPAASIKAKIASSFIATYTRREATQSSIDTTRVIIGRQLAENPDQLREFLRAAVPSIPESALQATEKQSEALPAA